jgi:acylphosphatase
VSHCLRYRVRGRVQGVFFRAGTRDEALRLGLTGWVRNAGNGDVEILACGAEAGLTDLERWLWQGPPAARVEAVERLAAQELAPVDFAIRY